MRNADAVVLVLAILLALALGIWSIYLWMP